MADMVPNEVKFDIIWDYVNRYARPGIEADAFMSILGPTLKEWPHTISPLESHAIDMAVWVNKMGKDSGKVLQLADTGKVNWVKHNSAATTTTTTTTQPSTSTQPTTPLDHPGKQAL